MILCDTKANKVKRKERRHQNIRYSIKMIFIESIYK